MLRFFNQDSGANLIEYGLLILLIAIVALVAVAFAGEQNSTLWSEVASSLN
ncbi:MAG: Flp family type IVb pilin [Acidimicrobiia bacterium]